MRSRHSSKIENLTLDTAYKAMNNLSSIIDVVLNLDVMQSHSKMKGLDPFKKTYTKEIEEMHNFLKTSTSQRLRGKTMDFREVLLDFVESLVNIEIRELFCNVTAKDL
ncbi:hypothetical protein ACFE04_004767 [Oxalis oulophora]